MFTMKRSLFWGNSTDIPMKSVAATCFKEDVLRQILLTQSVFPLQKHPISCAVLFQGYKPLLSQSQQIFSFFITCNKITNIYATKIQNIKLSA